MSECVRSPRDCTALVRCACAQRVALTHRRSHRCARPIDRQRARNRPQGARIKTPAPVVCSTVYHTTLSRTHTQTHASHSILDYIASLCTVPNPTRKVHRNQRAPQTVTSLFSSSLRQHPHAATLKMQGFHGYPLEQQAAQQQHQHQQRHMAEMIQYAEQSVHTKHTPPPSPPQSGTFPPPKSCSPKHNQQPTAVCVRALL